MVEVRAVVGWVMVVWVEVAKVAEEARLDRDGEVEEAVMAVATGQAAARCGGGGGGQRQRRWRQQRWQRWR